MKRMPYDSVTKSTCTPSAGRHLSCVSQFAQSVGHPRHCKLFHGQWRDLCAAFGDMMGQALIIYYYLLCDEGAWIFYLGGVEGTS